MRRDGIPYVQNPRAYYPPVDINKLSLDELKKKYLKMCGKSNGDVSVCSKCQTPCAEGKRATQLLANEVLDANIPLYGGKTLIERAKEENAARRAIEEGKKAKEALVSHAETKDETKEKPKKTKRSRFEVDEWWEASLAYGNQIEYLMKTYGVSKTQASKKLWYARKVKGEIKVEMPVLKIEEPKLVEPEVTQPEPQKELQAHSNDLAIRTFELMIGDMMKKQDEYKVQMEKYTKLYNEITAQINILCEAVDIANKNS